MRRPVSAINLISAFNGLGLVSRRGKSISLPPASSYAEVALRRLRGMMLERAVGDPVFSIQARTRNLIRRVREIVLDKRKKTIRTKIDGFLFSTTEYLLDASWMMIFSSGMSCQS